MNQSGASLTCVNTRQKNPLRSYNSICLIMAFWQENYAFIKDVYNTRANGLAELMSKTDKAIAEVLADKIYSSTDFKRIRENFL